MTRSLWYTLISKERASEGKWKNEWSSAHCFFSTRPLHMYREREWVREWKNEWDSAHCFFSMRPIGCQWCR